MSKLTGFIAFAFGATAGSLTTWYILKERYAQREKESIESVKQAYAKRYEAGESEETSDTHQGFIQDKPDISEYADILSREGYTNYSKAEDEAIKSYADKPYVIDGDQFGEFDDYSQITLTYYSDHVLADENDELVEDVDDVVGMESLVLFADEDVNVVLVRNDRLKSDFEICRDLGTYTDVIKSKPYLYREDE